MAIQISDRRGNGTTTPVIAPCHCTVPYPAHIGGIPGKTAEHSVVEAVACRTFFRTLHTAGAICRIVTPFGIDKFYSFVIIRERSVATYSNLRNYNVVYESVVVSHKIVKSDDGIVDR